jgi:hypothetical protein
MHIVCWRATATVHGCLHINLLIKSLFRAHFTLKVCIIYNLSANPNKKWIYHFHKNRISSQKRTSNKIKRNELELLKIENFLPQPKTFSVDFACSKQNHVTSENSVRLPKRIPV